MLISGFNLAAADYRASRRRLILPVAVAVVLTLLLLGQIGLWVKVRREGQATAQQLAQMEAELRRRQEGLRAARAAVPAEAMKSYQAKLVVLNEILEASAFSWTGLLTELERSVPPGVYLTHILPNLSNGKVAIRGVARTFDDLSRMLQTLGEQPAFRDVFLLRQSIKKATPTSPEALDFGLTLTYNKGRG